MNYKYKPETVIRQLFEYFGSKEKGWFRISIGNISSSNLDDVINTIEKSVVKSTSFVNSMIF